MGSQTMKRLVDIVVASIAILLLSPIFVLVAYKVRKHLGSPIFFYQERNGKNGKLFNMIKFRSMKYLCIRVILIRFSTSHCSVSKNWQSPKPKKNS